MPEFWKPGDVIAWRGIARNRPWHIQSVIVVKDSADELVVSFLPGAEGVAEKDYPKGRKVGKRLWDFTENEWQLAKYSWHTNRVLAIVQPEKYYSIMYFWHHERNEFLGYYVNFQLPAKRSYCGIDTLDLDLDLEVEPDLTFHWKDEADYQKAINHGLISAAAIQGIEAAKLEILDKLEKCQYPFDGSWLVWTPEPAWSPPTLPKNWDVI